MTTNPPRSGETVDVLRRAAAEEFAVVVAALLVGRIDGQQAIEYIVATHKHLLAVADRRGRHNRLVAAAERRSRETEVTL